MSGSLLEPVALGAGLAFTAAVQPGPLQAYLLSRVTAVGRRRTLPAAFAPLLSDGPIAALALLVLGSLSLGAQAALRAAGGVVLVALARSAYRQWRRPADETSGGSGAAPRSLFEAALVNLLNPNPYIGWMLIVGPLVVAAWQEAPRRGVALVAAFYVTMVASLVGLIVLFSGARLLGERVRRGALLLSAVLLLGLGAYQLVRGAADLRAALQEPPAQGTVEAASPPRLPMEES